MLHDELLDLLSRVHGDVAGLNTVEELLDVGEPVHPVIVHGVAARRELA